jgi:hypothetical protein
MLDQAAMPWFAELNRSLRDTLDDAQLPRAHPRLDRAAAPAGLEIHARALACVHADRPALDAQHWPRMAAVDCTMLFDAISQDTAEPV